MKQAYETIKKGLMQRIGDSKLARKALMATGVVVGSVLASPYVTNDHAEAFNYHELSALFKFGALSGQGTVKDIIRNHTMAEITGILADMEDANQREELMKEIKDLKRQQLQNAYDQAKGARDDYNAQKPVQEKYTAISGRKALEEAGLIKPSKKDNGYTVTSGRKALEEAGIEIKD